MTLAFAVVVVPDEIARLRTGRAGRLAYVTNWHLIAGDQSYFESIGRPSLFLHLWSLAIEEQFYLVWPLVLGASCCWPGAGSALAVTILGAVGSAAWMALLFDPAGDPSRRLLRHRHAPDRAPARVRAGVRLGPGRRRRVAARRRG